MHIPIFFKNRNFCPYNFFWFLAILGCFWKKIWSKKAHSKNVFWSINYTYKLMLPSVEIISVSCAAGKLWTCSVFNFRGPVFSLSVFWGPFDLAMSEPGPWGFQNGKTLFCRSTIGRDISQDVRDTSWDWKYAQNFMGQKPMDLTHSDALNGIYECPIVY